MVHRYSQQALERRHARAVEKGFLRNKKSDTVIVVPARVAQPVAVMAKALDRHIDLDLISGRSHHHLADAALAAKSQLGHEQFKQDMSLNASAGRAKHNVSDKFVYSGPKAGLHRRSWEELSDSDADSVSPVPKLVSAQHPWRRDKASNNASTSVRPEEGCGESPALLHQSISICDHANGECEKRISDTREEKHEGNTPSPSIHPWWRNKDRRQTNGVCEFPPHRSLEVSSNSFSFRASSSAVEVDHAASSEQVTFHYDEHADDTDRLYDRIQYGSLHRLLVRDNATQTDLSPSDYFDPSKIDLPLSFQDPCMEAQVPLSYARDLEHQLAWEVYLRLNCRAYERESYYRSPENSTEMYGDTYVDCERRNRLEQQVTVLEAQHVALSSDVTTLRSSIESTLKSLTAFEHTVIGDCKALTGSIQTSIMSLDAKIDSHLIAQCKYVDLVRTSVSDSICSLDASLRKSFSGQVKQLYQRSCSYIKSKFGELSKAERSKQGILTKSSWIEFWNRFVVHPWPCRQLL